MQAWISFCPFCEKSCDMFSYSSFRFSCCLDFQLKLTWISCFCHRWSLYCSNLSSIHSVTRISKCRSNQEKQNHRRVDLEIINLYDFSSISKFLSFSQFDNVICSCSQKQRFSKYHQLAEEMVNFKWNWRNWDNSNNKIIPNFHFKR